MPSISDKYKSQLEAAWRAPQDNPEEVWFYQRVLGTIFLEFVAFSERVFAGVSGKFKALDARVKTIEDMIAQAANQVQNGTLTTANGNGHAPPPVASPSPVVAQPSVTLSPSDMRQSVRLNSNGEPMSPEDQAAEEKMDMATIGSVDQSRYVPRSQLGG